MVESKEKSGQNVFLKIVIGLAIAAVVCLGIYVYNITIYFDRSGEMYYAKVDGMDTVLSFENGGHMTMYVFLFVDEETASRFGRMDYTYSGYSWKHLIGPFYFSSNSLLSLKNVKDGKQNATIVMSCTDAKLYDWFYTELDVSKLVGETDKMEVSFDGESMIMGGYIYQKIEDFPDNVKVYLDLIK